MVTFNINLLSIKKVIVGFLSYPVLPWQQVCRDFRKFLFHIFPCKEFSKFSKELSELIFKESTPKYIQTPNFSELSQGVWELGASEI